MPDFAVTPRPSPTLTSGLRDPGTTTSQRVKADVADEIYMYMPSAAPMSVLTTKVRKERTATQYQYDWLTKDQFPSQVVLAAASLAAATTVTVLAGTGGRLAANWTLLNLRTRETVLVTSMASADVANVVRAIGSTAQDMNAGDTLLFVRPVYEDGTNAGTIKGIREDREFNFTEIIKWELGWSGRQENTDMYGGKDPMTERKWAGVEFAKLVEKMLFFGTRHTRTGTNGRLQTFSGGLEFFIQSNVWDVNGITVSERAFVEYLEEAMRWGKGGYQEGVGVKYLFASSRWLTEIEFWAKDKLTYVNLKDAEGRELGLEALSYKSTHGRVMLIKAPILDESHPDYAFLVDLNHFRKVNHQGRAPKLYEDIGANDLDGSQEEYMGDIGAQVELEGAHGLLKGLPS